MSVCHAMPFSTRALKKTFSLTLILCSKNKSNCGFSWYVLLLITNTRHYSFPKHFLNFFCILSKFAKVFETEKSDAYKQLICIMQRLHFQIRVGVFNCQDKDFFDIVVKNNRMWFSVVYSLIDNDMRHHSGQNLLRTHSAAPRESTTFWLLWWRVSLSIRLYPTLNHIRFVK